MLTDAFGDLSQLQVLIGSVDRQESHRAAIGLSVELFGAVSSRDCSLILAEAVRVVQQSRVEALQLPQFLAADSTGFRNRAGAG